jgi:hypothetical protein
MVSQSYDDVPFINLSNDNENQGEGDQDEEEEEEVGQVGPDPLRAETYSSDDEPVDKNDVNFQTITLDKVVKEPAAAASKASTSGTGRKRAAPKTPKTPKPKSVNCEGTLKMRF